MFERADFTEANLTEVNFRHAQLTGAIFTDATIKRTDFWESRGLSPEAAEEFIKQFRKSCWLDLP